MNIQRRQFSACLVAALGSAPVAGLAVAQGTAPTEGKDYIRVNPPLPAPTNGKIEVIEFFWYGCPHCFAFEPALEAWVKKLPADVEFKRVPVYFREEPFAAHQRIYYALEQLGLVATMHQKVFNAIHVDHQRLDKPDAIAAFMAKSGVDKQKFLDAYNSFSVQTKARQARQLAEAYKVDAVPAMGIQGRYYTTASYAGSNERMLVVADYLIDHIRKGGA
jgi:thiol:disulfide interchange protein DsbA